MYRRLLSLLFVCISFSLSAQQIEIPQTQLSLVTKRTATWCPYCGTWGWTLFEGLLEDNSNKAVLMAAHYSGDLVNPASAAITNNFGGFGQPVFYLGNENQWVASSNIEEKRTTIKTKINDAYSSQPKAQAGMILVANDSQLDVYTKTRFFENSNGEYYLGVYLLEQNLFYYQSGQGQDAHHKNVLRESLTDEELGELIAEGSISAGSEFAFNTSIPLDETYDLGNLTVVTILWEKVDSKYNFVNANSSNNYLGGLVATEEELLKISSFEIQPNPVVDQARINLELGETFSYGELALIDLQGRKIQTVYAGSFQEGSNVFTISKEQFNLKGLYFLQFKANQKVATRKALFR